MPADMVPVVQRLQRMHKELKPVRLTSRPQIQAEFKGKKVRAVRNRIHFRPLNEPFHEFLVNHLLWTLGESWFNAEMKNPSEQRHVILQWRAELYGLVRQAQREQLDGQAGRVAFIPTGNVKALFVLADDVYQVEHALKTPKKIVRRLREHRGFQGARYEILAASLFARCGFDIEFIDDKTKKNPEFFATRTNSGEKIAIEAKSRHRPGVLHEPGTAPEVTVLRGDVERLLHEALQQNPGGLPFFVFIDLNLPLTPGVPTEGKPWFKDLKEIFGRIEAGTPGQQDNFTGVIFTNFGWYYSREKGTPGGEYLMVNSFDPRFPVSEETWQLLRRALDEYGFIPDEEQHEKEVRARYPEFNNSR